jgi:hypothetical protein
MICLPRSVKCEHGASDGCQASHRRYVRVPRQCDSHIDVSADRDAPLRGAQRASEQDARLASDPALAGDARMYDPWGNGSRRTAHRSVWTLPSSSTSSLWYLTVPADIDMVLPGTTERCEWPSERREDSNLPPPRSPRIPAANVSSASPRPCSPKAATPMPARSISQIERRSRNANCTACSIT